MSIEKTLQEIQNQFRVLAGLPPISGGAPASAEYSLEMISDLIANGAIGSGGGGAPSGVAGGQLSGTYPNPTFVSPIEIGAVEASDYVDTPLLKMTQPPNGGVEINAVGLGVQMAIAAANGGADHIGGEMSLIAGSSAGQGGGVLTVASGSDSGGADGGAVVIASGNSPGVGLGGDSGEITIRAGGGSTADGSGGQVAIAGGAALDGDGGSIDIRPGNSTNGMPGSLALRDGSSAQGIDITPDGVMVKDKVGFYMTAPVAKPEVAAIPTAQAIVDALVTLGLISQAV